ncbi:unnamed protein product, partial [Polarella glacialis]
MVLYVLSPRLLNVFLSWLSSVLENLNYGIIIAAVIFAGIICFLLPPVPGVPVYVFGGVILADTCPLGFTPGCFIAIAVSYVLKLMACAMQQKLIGGLLGRNLKIRCQVGVNKPFIRAIEAVLRRPGLSMGKVAILCGGPDWPTSVLAGVLKLSLFECELGTMPIIVFITPCSLSGSYYLKSSESE